MEAEAEWGPLLEEVEEEAETEIVELFKLEAEVAEIWKLMQSGSGSG